MPAYDVNDPIWGSEGRPWWGGIAEWTNNQWNNGQDAEKQQRDARTTAYGSYQDMTGRAAQQQAPGAVPASAGRLQGNESMQTGLWNQYGQNNYGYNAQNQNQSRDQQMQLLQQLQAQASGQAPSLAEATMGRSADQNMAGALAMAAQQRGPGGGAAMRNAGWQRAGIGQGLAADAGMMRLNEQMQARNQMGGLLGQMRGADFQQEQGRLGAQGMQDQAKQAQMQQLMQLAQMQQQAGLGAAQLGSQNDAAYRDWLARMSLGQGNLAQGIGAQEHKQWWETADRAAQGAGTAAKAIGSL